MQFLILPDYKSSLPLEVEEQETCCSNNADYMFDRRSEIYRSLKWCFRRVGESRKFFYKFVQRRERFVREVKTINFFFVGELGPRLRLRVRIMREP